MDPNTRQAKRTPVTLKIKFKSATLDEFIERYAVDVSHGGIFIRTKEPLAVGTSMKFEFQLKDATPLISGEGTVVWTRENDPARPGVAPGMGVRFDRLGDGSQLVLDKILAQKGKTATAASSTVDPKVFEQPTRAFGANEAPTRVAPSPLASALAAGAGPEPKLGQMAPPKSGFQDERTDHTPLPNPVPFHSDADEFPDEAFEEATKVRSVEELVAQTAKFDQHASARAVATAAAATAAANRPDEKAAEAAAAEAAAAAAAATAAAEDKAIIDELAARRAARLEPAKAEPVVERVVEPLAVTTQPEPTVEAVKAEAPKAEAPKAEAAKPKHEAKSKPVSKAAPRADVPAKVQPRAVTPTPAPAAPERKSSALPILLLLFLLIGGAAAAYYFLIYKKKGSEEQADSSPKGSGAKGSGSAKVGSGTAGTGSGTAATGSGTAGSGSGTSAAGSGTATTGSGSAGSGSAAAGGAPDAGVVEAAEITVTIGANVKGAQVEIIGTDQSGPAPFKAKLTSGTSYTARITADGYLPVEVPVTDQPVTATLASIKRVLKVTSQPAGASIYIDGEFAGKVTPAEIELTAKQAAKARLKVTLRKANHDRFDTVVQKTAFTKDGDQLLAGVSGSLTRQKAKSGGGGGGGGDGGGDGDGAGSGTGTGSDGGGDGSGSAGGTGGGSGSAGGTGGGSGSSGGTGGGSGSAGGTGGGSGSSGGTGGGSGSSGASAGSGTRPGSGSSEPTPEWAK